MKRAPNIADLIGAPLTAAASANSKMLKLQTAYLFETCFVKKDDDSFEPVMIEMSIFRSSVDSSDRENPTLKNYSAKFKVPLLTLIPINSLAVDSVDINFSLEIVSQKEVSSDQTIEGETNLTNTKKSEQKKTELSGRVSYDSKDIKKEKSHNSSKLDVKMQAKSLPLPLGITTLIDLYVKTINAKSTSEDNE